MCCKKAENPFFVESTAPHGTFRFDQLKNEHFRPAFDRAMAEHKAEIEAINKELAERTDYESDEYMALIEKVSTMSEKFYAIDLTHFEEDVEKALLGLGFERSDFNRPTSDFSGGWRMRIELAKLLCEKSGMKKVFFANSGAEANECAIKVARKWAAENKGADCYKIVTLQNSFHGRTLATLAATGQDTFHTDFGPFTPGFYYAPADDAKAVRKLAEENGCCAVMMELVQGEGGVIPLTQEFMDEIFKLAEEYNLVTVIDEVQTGNGRLGSLYGSRSSP